MSYRARNAARRATRRYVDSLPTKPVRTLSVQDVLKFHYPQAGEPDWGPCVRDAFRRNWVTWEGLQRIPKWDRRPGIYDLAYAKSPFFEMLRSEAKP